VLFDEWNGRKEGLPDTEIFAARHGGPLKEGDAALNELIKQNIAESEACFKAMAHKSIMNRSADLLKLRAAHKSALGADDTGAAVIFELKMKEIVCAQAAVWNRLSREQQNLLLRELPPQADWMLAIAAAEKLMETAARPAPTPADPNRVVLEAGALQTMQPRVLVAELPEETTRRMAQLKDRAKAEPEGKLFRAGAVYDAKPPENAAAEVLASPAPLGATVAAPNAGAR
jgi:hypothetical protein